jgi:hypothetical protein
MSPQHKETSIALAVLWRGGAPVNVVHDPAAVNQTKQVVQPPGHEHVVVTERGPSGTSQPVA